MILSFVDMLPDPYSSKDPKWAHWQIDAIVDFINDICIIMGYSTWPIIIAGCNEDYESEFGTGPEDFPTPDSIGVFYADEDEEEANKWTEICLIFLARMQNAIKWELIRPESIRQKAARLGLRPAFVSPVKKRSGGVAMTKDEIDAMERAKNDVCDLELARVPDEFHGNRINSYPLVNLVQRYVDFICGPIPDGVERVYLWVESKRWKIVRTGLPAKVFAGWGLNCPLERRQDAHTYAELFRLAYYNFVGSVDWDELDVDSIIDELERSGLLDSDY